MKIFDTQRFQATIFFWIQKNLPATEKQAYTIRVSENKTMRLEGGAGIFYAYFRRRGIGPARVEKKLYRMATISSTRQKAIESHGDDFARSRFV